MAYFHDSRPAQFPRQGNLSRFVVEAPLTTQSPGPYVLRNGQGSYDLETLGTIMRQKNQFKVNGYNRYEAEKGGQRTGLEFRDLSYAVTKKVKKEGQQVKKQVSLLSEISGRALKGDVTAVLGPSGAGKSTFLDALAGRIAKGSLQGSVSVDGQQITTSYMKQISSYVMQDDQLFPMLTVQETFMFAAEVRLPTTLSREEKQERVRRLIDQLGLKSATDTYIGDEGIRGVSGGERRRVSIGVDIIHGPSLLFLDEPTSGLDSTSAFTVVEKLQDIARDGSMVMLTIHQPSSRIQRLFNTMIILARGRLIFLGAPLELDGYLETFGRQVPEGENCIEYLLDVIKEYDESTLGLEPLVQYQRHGVKPTEAMKTPMRRTPLVTPQPWKHPSSVATSHIPTPSMTHDGRSGEYLEGAPFYHDLDEEEFDKSLDRRTPLNNFHDPKLASNFYKGLSLFLYNEVVDSVRGTPGPPTWIPPPATATPDIVTPMSLHATTPHHHMRTPYQDTSSMFSDGGFDISERHQPKFANSWLREVYVLMWRNVLNIIRTPELFLSREVVFIVMGVMLATLFRKRLDKTDTIDTATNILNFFIFSVSLLFFSSNDAVPAFIQERYIYIRETSHNAYRASSYTIASLIVNLPFFAIQAFTFTIITFFLLCLQGHWWVFGLILYASLITTNSFVVFISAVVPNFITGYAVVIASTALFFLSCGFFVKRKQIPKYYLGLHYISTIKYPFEALLINQFHITNSNNAFCYSIDSNPLVPGPIGSIDTVKNISRPPSCYAVGEDILKSMDITHDDILLDVGILLAWGVLYRLLFYIILRFYSKNERK